jgi:selenocysteine-specific elongation factor
MSDATHYIVATAGHVDHGKSALIKALTGTDPDRLPEEKARGITIDLGFAHLEVPSPVSSAPFHVGIVDVPGHEDFVTNMVAGVGAIDLALLIVAADDGWMPQTEEHLQILSYFGVRHGVVALTKIDLVADEAAAVAGVRERLAGTAFANVPIVPTSVVTGRGFDTLRSTIASELSAAPPPRDIGKPRLAVDRVFSLPGAGTIVTGTLVGGSLQRGQSVAIQPGGHAARIRRLQSHGRDVETAVPGTRAALNLADLHPVAGVHRGDVITRPDLSGSSDCVDTMLEVSCRANRPLKDGVRVRIHFGSGNVPAHVALGAGKELAAGGRRVAQLRLESPVFLCAGDRLTVRDWSEQQTLAGAIVLDPDATRRRFRTPDRQQWLTRVAESLDAPAPFVAAFVGRDTALRRDRTFLKTRFSMDDIDAAIQQLVSNGSVVAVPSAARGAKADTADMLVDSTTWGAARRRAADLIDEAHRQHPERQGLPLTDLRGVLAKEFPLDDVFDALVGSLSENDFSRFGTVIRRMSHRAQLPESLRAAGETVRRLLAAQALEPPSRKELTPDPPSQRALKFLIESGEVVEINADLVMSAGAVADATERVKAFVVRNGPATVSEVRQFLGSSRRIVVPLLEYLDRTFVTVRHGDKRALR